MNQKERFAKQARIWEQSISNSDTWNDAINQAIEDTNVHDVGMDLETVAHLNARHYDTVLSFTTKSSYEAIKQLWDKGERNICVLNFASYFVPGGNYFKGSVSQEESLCLTSGLYRVLVKCRIYDGRQNSRVSPMYTSEMIYSEKVPFTQEYGVLSEEPILIDVLSAHAPNCNSIFLKELSSYVDVIRERVDMILQLPLIHGAECIVLGAWGVGNLGNDVSVIANEFSRATAIMDGKYKEIVYAIPNSQTLCKFMEAHSNNGR